MRPGGRSDCEMVKCIRLINRSETLEVAAISPALSPPLYLCVISRGFGETEACCHRASAALIYGGLWFHQDKRRDLDIKLLLAIVDHLVGSLHRPEGHGERAA
jgi:hypothetical protein